jgi:hypothetical protein
MCYPCPDTPVTYVSGPYTAAKKVTKESSSYKPAVTRTLARLASRPWHSPKKLLQNYVQGFLSLFQQISAHASERNAS